MTTSRLQFAALLLACLAPLGCEPATTVEPAHGEPAPAATSGGESDGVPGVDIPNAAQPLPDVLSGGKPSDANLETAAARGYRTVVSLLPDADAEREKVEALGMRFVSIPVAGADDLTQDKARELDAALSGPDATPAIVHCGSGNRAGALLALRAFYVDGMDAEEAIDLGKRAGLRSLEGAVRERISEETAE